MSEEKERENPASQLERIQKQFLLLRDETGELLHRIHLPIGDDWRVDINFDGKAEAMLEVYDGQEGLRHRVPLPSESNMQVRFLWEDQ